MSSGDSAASQKYHADVPNLPSESAALTELDETWRLCDFNPRTDGQPWEPWEGNGPCQDCGQRNVVWTTDSATWRAVIGNAGGIFCPSCFIVRAFAVGLGVNTMWTLSLPAVPMPERFCRHCGTEIAVRAHANDCVVTCE